MNLDEFKRKYEQSKELRKKALEAELRAIQKPVALHPYVPYVLHVIGDLKDSGEKTIAARTIARALMNAGIQERFNDLCSIVSGILKHDLQLEIKEDFPTICVMPDALPVLKDGVLEFPPAPEAKQAEITRESRPDLSRSAALIESGSSREITDPDELRRVKEHLAKYAKE